jgi:uncharacterized membrane protein YphA (DoxX/SURF4 family)
MLNASTTTEGWAPRVLSILRIVSGLIFLAHGTQKFLRFPGGERAGSGLALDNPGAYAGLIELVAGLLITLGLFTRPAAFLASERWRPLIGSRTRRRTSFRSIMR